MPIISHFRRQHVHFLLWMCLVCFVVTGCRTFVPATPGESVPSQAAPPEPTLRTTTPNGWMPATSSKQIPAIDMEPGIRALAAAIDRRNGVRVLIYFNQRLSANPSAWHVNRRSSLAYQGSEAGNGSRNEKSGSLSVYVEQALPAQEGSMPLIPLLGTRLEEIATRALLQAGVTIVDPSMLFRKTAYQHDLRTFRQTEIVALSEGADVLMEISFVGDETSNDGFAVVVKVVDVEDSTVLAMSSSTNTIHPEKDKVIYSAEAGGFTRHVAEDQYSLEEHCRIVLNDVLQQWAVRL